MQIELNPVTSGYSTGVINDNFQKVEEELNTNFLRRDGVEEGQPNQMEVSLDMNGFPILNTSTDINDSASLITVGEADNRYVNTSGDSMSGPLSVLAPASGTHPVRKQEFDQEHNIRVARENSIETSYRQADAALTLRVSKEEDKRASEDNRVLSASQAGDANLQAQLTGEVPLEASAFSPISWHSQEVSSSVTIPDNVNAWSFGPTMTIAEGQAVEVGNGSFWTIANGEVNQ